MFLNSEFVAYSELNYVLSEANHVQERSISNLSLIQVTPAKIEETTWYEAGLVESLILSCEHTLRRSLEQIEGTLLDQDAVFHEIKDILHFLFRSKGALNDVAVWHLNSYFGTSVVSLALYSLEFKSAAISELRFLLLASNKCHCTSSFIILIHTRFVIRVAGADNSTTTASLIPSGVNHRAIGGLCSSCSFISHFLISWSSLCSGLTVLHHGEELISIHGWARYICLLVVYLNLAVFHAVLHRSFPIRLNCIDLTLRSRNLRLASFSVMSWRSRLACRWRHASFIRVESLWIVDCPTEALNEHFER